MPMLLLLLLALAMSTGSAMVVLVIRRGRRQSQSRPIKSVFDTPVSFASPHHSAFLPRPSSWLAVKSRNLAAVQAALGLHNPKPCSWQDGLAGEEKLFIAPPVKGWILIFGCDLPDPADDIDACFRFVVSLSRKLGHVQYFSA